MDEPELPRAEGGGCGPLGGLGEPFLALPAQGCSCLRTEVSPWGGRVSTLSPACFFPQLLEGNFALFCTYTLGFRNEFQNILLAIMVGMGLVGSLGCSLGLRGGRDTGTGIRGPLGQGEGEGAAKCPAKAGWVGRNSRAFVPAWTRAQTGETRSHGGLLSKSCHLSPSPPFPSLP